MNIERNFKTGELLSEEEKERRAKNLDIAYTTKNNLEGVVMTTEEIEEELKRKRELGPEQK